MIDAETYERSAVKALRQRNKRSEQPQLPGKVFAIHFTPSGGNRPQKAVRYALTKQEAIAKVKEENPGCTLRPLVQAFDYATAQQKLTVRVGCISTLLPASDAAEVRDDLLAWEATRQPILIRPQSSAETARFAHAVKVKGNSTPPPTTEGTLTWADLIDALKDEFDIDKGQTLRGIVRRHLKDKLHPTPADDATLRYSESDVSLLRRFLRHHQEGKYLRKEPAAD